MLDAFTFAVPASSSWQQVNFTLTPSASTNCVGITPGSDPAIDCGNFGPGIGHVCVRCAGEFAIFVNGPSTVHVGYVFLQPGEWGRFQGLPVLLSAVQVLQTMGINVIRQGGTFAQTIVWKDWRGPPTQRPSMQLTWGASLISGTSASPWARARERVGQGNERSEWLRVVRRSEWLRAERRSERSGQRD